MLRGKRKCGIGFEAGCKISGFGAQAHLRITFEARKLAIRKQEFAVLSRSRTMATRMIGGFDMKETPV